MKRAVFGAAFFLASVPMSAGVLYSSFIDPTSFTPTNTGITLAPNQQINVTVTGTMDLLGNDGVWPTHPDGSLVAPLSSAQPGTFTAFYATYVNPGASPYPQAFGGDGINHYAGGGTNFDTVNPGTFPAIGKHTTDTTDNDPHVLRLGSIAYTFAANPGQLDWLLLGYGGLISSPTGGTLKVMIVDTAYWNNTGGFTVTVNDVAATPEPSAAWLAFSGIALVGLVRTKIWRRR